MVRIRLDESQLNKLFEYRNEPRLPFDDDFYGKKNQAEHYLDWLEEFGRYGEIGGSELKLNDCVLYGVRSAIEHGRISINYYDDEYDGVELLNNRVKDVSDYLLNDKFRHITFDDRGNIYVERAIMLRDDISSVIGDLFSDLSNSYGGNVGGCWAFKVGYGSAYCSRNDDSTRVLMKGWIRLEDIDWLKTCDLNNNHNEYEIRVKPNAKVELFEVIMNNRYKLPLKGKLVVSSTYFGNRSGYVGDFATVDDGMGGKRIIDREGNYINFEKVSDINHLFGEYYVVKNRYGKCTIINKVGEQVLNSWYNDIGMLGNKFIYVYVLDYNFKTGYNFISIDGHLLSDIWFSGINLFSDDLVEVQLSEEECNLMDINGNLLYDEWYYFIDELGDNGIAKIIKDASHISYIKSDGSFLIDEWFENASVFRGNVAVVKRLKNEDTFEVEGNFLNSDGLILYPDHWFSAIRLYDRNDFNKQYQLRINNKWFYADGNGKIDYDHPFDKSW